MRAAARRCLVVWHLTSVDAATVAVVWSAALAWAAGVPVATWRVALQGLAVWTVYVIDRLLDARTALGAGDMERLRERHFFHWRHRRALAPMAAAAAVAIAGVMMTAFSPGALARSAVLTGAVVIYFARVHWLALIHFGQTKRRGTAQCAGPYRVQHLRLRASRRGVQTKEMVVGVLFASGCALPETGWIGMGISGILLCVVGFLALLAWLNCRSIEKWESERYEENPAHRKRRLCAGWIVAGAGAALAAGMAAHPRAALLLFAGAASAALLGMLERERHRLHLVVLRAAADLALLTPLLLLPFRWVGR